MNASAILGQAASMIAAPGSSILPSRSRSRRLPPSFRQSTSSESIFADCGLGAGEPWSRRRSSGTVSIARTSWVAPAFIAEVTSGSVHLPSLPLRRRRL